MKDADLERFPSLLFVTRQDSSEIVFCNNYTVEKIGRPLNAIVGSKLSSIVTHATEVFFESYMRPILVSTPFFEEALITLKTHDNRRIPCVANIAVNEGMLYWSIHFADKRDKLYQELIEARDNLERQAEQLSLLARVDPLTNLLNRRAANNDRQMIRRAGGCAEGTDFLVQERDHFFFVQHGRSLLIQERFVGGTATLGNEQKPISIAPRGVDIALRWQVIAGIHFLEHGKRGHIRIAQVAFLIGFQDSVRNCSFVISPNPDVLALFRHDDRRACILTHRQNAARCDIGVLQKIQCDEAVIVRGFGILQDLSQLLQMEQA